MSTPLTERELKRSSATLLVLALVDETPRHGYDIGKLIEQRSGGKIAFQMASLYPLLEPARTRGWINGKWQDKAGSGGGGFTASRRKAGASWRANAASGRPSSAPSTASRGCDDVAGVLARHRCGGVALDLR